LKSLSVALLFALLQLSIFELIFLHQGKSSDGVKQYQYGF